MKNSPAIGSYQRAHETMMAVPHDLVPAVRELISRYEEEHLGR